MLFSQWAQMQVEAAKGRLNETLNDVGITCVEVTGNWEVAKDDDEKLVVIVRAQVKPAPVRTKAWVEPRDVKVGPFRRHLDGYHVNADAPTPDPIIIKEVSKRIGIPVEFHNRWDWYQSSGFSACPTCGTGTDRYEVGPDGETGEDLYRSDVPRTEVETCYGGCPFPPWEIYTRPAEDRSEFAPTK